MTSTSGPGITLVISSSEPERMTMARPGEPALAIAVNRPSAIDSTATKTTTTPAMPTIATAEEPARCGSVRRLRRVTAPICVSQDISRLSQRIRDADAHGAHGGQQSREKSDHRHEPDADDQITARQLESGQQPPGRVAGLDEHPRDEQSGAAADERDEERFGEHQREDSHVGEAECLQDRQLAGSLAYRLRHRVADDEQDGE